MRPPAIGQFQFRKISSGPHCPAITLGIQSIRVSVGGNFEQVKQLPPITTQPAPMGALRQSRVSPVEISIKESISVGERSVEAEPLVELREIADDRAFAYRPSGADVIQINKQRTVYVAVARLYQDVARMKIRVSKTVLVGMSN